jgi:hypothetical protein
MPVKRRTSKIRDHKITPEAIAAWIRGTEIREHGDPDHWEDEGGNRHAYLDAVGSLASALGLKPWEPSPLATIGRDDVPEFEDADAWRRAVDLRDVLFRESRKAAHHAG